MHHCDWPGCAEPRAQGVVYCAEHLGAEYERWLSEAEPEYRAVTHNGRWASPEEIKLVEVQRGYPVQNGENI